MQHTQSIEAFKKNAVEAIINSIPDVETIYIFGSFIKGDATNESDIDLAFLSNRKIDNLMRWDIQEELAKLLNRDVDLVDLNQASEVMQFQVVHYGQRIFARVNQEAEKYEDKVYSLYVDLCELRKPIIDNIQESGSIYG